MSDKKDAAVRQLHSLGYQWTAGQWAPAIPTSEGCGSGDIGKAISVPAGYALVPLEPTPEMIAAWNSSDAADYKYPRHEDFQGSKEDWAAWAKANATKDWHVMVGAYLKSATPKVEPVTVPAPAASSPDAEAIARGGDWLETLEAADDLIKRIVASMKVGSRGDALDAVVRYRYEQRLDAARAAQDKGGEA